MTSCRNINLNFALRSSTVRKKALAGKAEIKDYELSRMLSGKTTLTDAVLLRASSMLGLDAIPGFSIRWFEDLPLAFESRLRSSRFGKLEGEQGPAWLDEVSQCRCVFVPEELVRALSAAYRDSFGRAAPPDPDQADTEGVVGQVYGVMSSLIPGVVADAVRGGRAAALLVHRDRSNGWMDMAVTDPSTGRGSIDIVEALAPLVPDPELAFLDGASNVMDPVPCLLAGAGGGYKIEGRPSRRDVNVFLFVRDAVPSALLRLASGRVEADVLLQVRAAVGRANSDGHVIAMRFVYDAR